MTEGGWVSSKTEATPILVSEGTSQNGALQLLADRYAKRLARINAKLALKIAAGQTSNNLHYPAPYYDQAEAAVRALYADAT
jgi:hypothetical protein